MNQTEQNFTRDTFLQYLSAAFSHAFLGGSFFFFLKLDSSTLQKHCIRFAIAN